MRAPIGLLGSVCALVLAAAPASAADSTGAATPCPPGSNVSTGGDLAAAVAATPTGGTLCLDGGSHSVPDTVWLWRSMSIVGVNAPELTQTFSGWFFQVTASDVRIEGVTMVGADRSRTGESCSGSGAVRVNAVSRTEVLDNVALTSTCGILLDGSSDFSVHGNTIAEVGYAGIAASAVTRGSITSNAVADVNHDGALGENAYGIVISGMLSQDVRVSGNRVERAPTWECFDTHGGQSIDFLGNTCVGPGRVGISSIATGAWFPSGRIEGNHIDAGGLDSAWNSIAFAGAGSVQGNTIAGFGDCLIWAPNATVSANACE